MYTFEYQRPASVKQALALLESGGRALAGGQTLLASMKLRLARVDTLVDLGAIPELTEIRRDGNGLWIGAMARHADVATHADVLAAIPALAELAGHIGDMQVRSMGTLGGSVANNDPAACYPAALLALGATIHTSRRSVAADDFFTGMFSTALGDGELITAVHFPVPRRAAYMKFKQAASRFALVGVFVAQTDIGVRVAVTGAANGVFRHAGLEQALGRSFTVQTAAAVQIDPSDLNSDMHASAAYRAHLIRVQTQRAVAKALS